MNDTVVGKCDNCGFHGDTLWNYLRALIWFKMDDNQTPLSDSLDMLQIYQRLLPSHLGILNFNDSALIIHHLILNDWLQTKETGRRIPLSHLTHFDLEKLRHLTSVLQSTTSKWHKISIRNNIKNFQNNCRHGSLSAENKRLRSYILLEKMDTVLGHVIYLCE